ncbi:TPA: hypothetical protein QHM67_004777 [Escherichia coli]|nr:hypothetical protein [Escherichia coli]
MIDTTYRRSSSLYCHQTTDRIGTEASANPVRGKKLAQVIAKLLPLQLLRGVGLEQRQHVHLARKSLVEAVNADQIPDLYGSRVPCLQATMHGLPVATRPKIKMVQLQFTPFASDVSLANHDVTTFPRQVSSVSTAIKVVFVIEAAFHNSIGIIGCN